MKNEITKEQFLHDVRNHKMEIIKDEEIFRHIRFKQPDSCNMYFDLITLPGLLLYTGDMGTFVFSRVHDMFRFFRNEKNKLEPSFGYWAEKCLAEDTRSNGIREFDIEKFKECVIEDTLSHLEKESIEELTEDEMEEIEHLLRCNDEYEAVEEIRNHDSEIIPLTDFFENTLTSGTVRYLWCCYAIQWGIMQYDEFKKEVVK